MSKKDLATIELTKTQAAKYTVDQITSDLVPRLSNRRCKAFLVNQVEAGAIQVPAVAIGAWTYKAVAVKGVEVPDTVAGKKVAVLELTEAKYAELGAKGVARLIEEHTTEKRAAYVVQALLVKGKVTPSAHDLVYLSNGRVAVEGIAIESTRQGIDMGALIAGVTIGKPATSKAA